MDLASCRLVPSVASCYSTLQFHEDIVCAASCWLLAAAMKVLNARAGRVDHIADCCTALQKSVLYFVWYSNMTHSTNHN